MPLNAPSDHCKFVIAKKKARQPCGAGLIQTMGLEETINYTMKYDALQYSKNTVVKDKKPATLREAGFGFFAIQEKIPETQSYLESGPDV